MKIYKKSRNGPNFNVLVFAGFSRKIFINVNF